MGQEPRRRWLALLVLAVVALAVAGTASAQDVPAGATPIEKNWSELEEDIGSSLDSLTEDEVYDGTVLVDGSVDNAEERKECSIEPCLEQVGCWAKYNGEWTALFEDVHVDKLLDGQTWDSEIDEADVEIWCWIQATKDQTNYFDQLRVPIAVDQVDPSIGIDAPTPSAGEIVDGSVPLGWITDDGYPADTRILYRPSGDDSWTEATTVDDTGETVLETGFDQDLEIEVGLQAIDAVGHESPIAVSDPFLVDVTPPTTSISNPEAGAEVDGEVEIRWTVEEDNLGTTTVEVGAKADDGSVSTWTTLQTDHGNASGSVTWDTDDLDGEYRIRVEHEDLVGHVEETVLDVLMDDPNAPEDPDPSMTSPEADTVVGGVVTVTWDRLRDDVSSATLFYKPADGEETTIADDVDDATSAKWDTVAEELDTTEATLRLEATNPNGTNDDTTVVTVDNVDPAVTIQAPGDGGEVDGEFTVEWSTTEPNVDCIDIESSSDGSSWTPHEECVADDGEAVLDAADLDGWPADLRVRAHDLAGNTGSDVVEVRLADEGTDNQDPSNPAPQNPENPSDSPDSDPLEEWPGEGDGGVTVETDGDGWVRMTVTDRDDFLKRLVVRFKASTETARLQYRAVDSFGDDVPAPPDRLDVHEPFDLTALDGSRQTEVDWARMWLAVDGDDADVRRPASLAHFDGEWSLQRPDKVNRSESGAIYEFEVDGLSPFALGYLQQEDGGDWMELVLLVVIGAGGAVAGAAIVARRRHDG